MQSYKPVKEKNNTGACSAATGHGLRHEAKSSKPARDVEAECLCGRRRVQSVSNYAIFSIGVIVGIFGGIFLVGLAIGICERIYFGGD